MYQELAPVSQKFTGFFSQWKDVSLNFNAYFKSLLFIKAS